MKSTRAQLLASVSEKIVDYRRGEIEPRSPDVVDAWVKQFDAGAQEGILSELDHVLSKVYISKVMFRKWLSNLTSASWFCGADPKRFWSSANLLTIQTGGSSQSDLLEMLDAVLNDNLGISLNQCGSEGGPLIYLDDLVCGGTRMHNDFRDRFLAEAPKSCTVKAVHLVRHSGGEWHAGRAFQQDWANAGKSIAIDWSRCIKLENRLFHRDQSDVLWPICMPPGPSGANFAKTLVSHGHAPMFRKPGAQGRVGVFSSETGRHLLEQQFLQQGLSIVANSPNLPSSVRPLGWVKLETLGPGVPVVTYRNCPNSCPLVFWVDSWWTPLFPRKTNSPSPASLGFKVESDY